MKPGLRQALARQPRECRDTLFLLACIAATLIPHAGHLPLWTCALTGLVLFWRGLLAWRGQALPGRWPLVAVLAVSVSLTWLSHHSLIGREPGITLLVMLMALKTLELRARRDAFVVFFLGFFLVLTHFLYSQSLLTALWTLLSVWGLLSALVLAQMPVGQPSLKLAAGLAGRSALAGLPVMVLLFLLFPRIAPLWGLPADSVGRTGLSNRMEMGAMAEIANDDSIAMRLRFEGAPPPPQARYFRGPVLAHFDGRVWRPADLGPAGWPSRSEDLQLRGSPLRYELTLEPLRIKVLPLLEMSPEPAGTTRALDSIALRREPELQWSAPRPITERLRLNAEAQKEEADRAEQARALEETRAENARQKAELERRENEVAELKRHNESLEAAVAAERGDGTLAKVVQQGVEHQKAHRAELKRKTSELEAERARGDAAEAALEAAKKSEERSTSEKSALQDMLAAALRDVEAAQAKDAASSESESEDEVAASELQRVVDVQPEKPQPPLASQIRTGQPGSQPAGNGLPCGTDTGGANGQSQPGRHAQNMSARQKGACAHSPSQPGLRSVNCMTLVLPSANAASQ